VAPTRAVPWVEAIGIRSTAISWCRSWPVSSARSLMGTSKVRNGPSGVTSSMAPGRGTVDLSLPGMAGLDVARHIRARSDAPMLFIAARAETDAEMAGLASWNSASSGAALTGFCASSSSDFWLPSGYRQLRRLLRFLAVVPVTYVGQQCTFGVAGMLCEMPEQSDSDFLVNARVAQKIAD
jgi:hypothetical protein